MYCRPLSHNATNSLTLVHDKWHLCREYPRSVLCYHVACKIQSLKLSPPRMKRNTKQAPTPQDFSNNYGQYTSMHPGQQEHNDEHWRYRNGYENKSNKSNKSNSNGKHSER